MKTFLVVFTTMAVASASVVQFSPTLYTAAIPITTQYHAQDGLGQYSYGYSGGPSAKAEYKSLDGVTRGSYSYVDADGELQTVEYTADSANGFQASATNLPKAPIDDKVAPKPVEDTPEVAMAKAEHLAAVREAELRAAEDPSNGDENGNDGHDGHQQQNGSQERQAALSRESTSAETESPNGLDGSNERGSQESGIGGSSLIAGNGNGNGNGNGKGNGNGNGNGNNGITRLASNGLSSGLSLSGISSSISSSLSNGLSAINLNGLNNGLSSSLSNGLSSLSLGSLNGNGQLTSSGLNGLSSLQLNGDLSSGLDNGNDAMRFSEITPATTTQLRPLSLTSVRLPVPATSYLRVSTPTHGYSIISPTVLTAVPTLRATSSQTISRTLPISLSSSFLTQGLH